MKIKFWGAAQTVTGSMHLIELGNGKKLVLDCGIYQGGEGFAEEYNRTFPCDPAEINFLILSHAHIDHCGNLPQLVKAGFRGEIYSTHATYDLCSIMLMDSAGIQEKDAEYENKYLAKKGLPLKSPIYTRADVPRTLSRFVSLSYDLWHTIDPQIDMLFLDAGHMLGSASVTLRIREEGRVTMVGFTGDIGRSDQPILRDPVPMPQVDYLISESTYGGKDHESLGDASETFLEIINRTCVIGGGKLIIPAFSVGRTQNLVYALDRFQSEGRLPPIPVYVDSPLAVNATQVFELHPECYDKDMVAYMESDPDPFGWNNLHYVRSAEESKAINASKRPSIIISASGMMSAGRILHHLKNNIENPATTILAVGYCAENTLGSRLINGDKEVKIFGETYQVKASVERLNSFSGHAGQTELYNFIAKGQDPNQLKKLFLVHGEADRVTMFKEFMEGKKFRDVIGPHRGDVFDL